MSVAQLLVLGSLLAALGLAVEVDLVTVDGRTTKVSRADKYNGNSAVPLILALHGWGSNPNTMRNQWSNGHVDTANIIIANPKGRRDRWNYRYWAGWGDWCGDCGPSNLDVYPCVEKCGDEDAPFLMNLVAEIKRQYNIDSQKVYLYGYSNGCGMAYRLICDYSEVFAGIIAIAGAPPEDGWKDGYMCRPTSPVNVLHVHGTVDGVTRYNGLEGPKNPYKGAITTVKFFAEQNSCRDVELPKSAGKGQTTQKPVWSLSDKHKHKPKQDKHSKETEIYTLDKGCEQGVSVTLWKLRKQGHFFVQYFNKKFFREVLKWMDAHPKLEGRQLYEADGGNSTYSLPMIYT